MDIRKTALSILRDAEQKEKYVALALNAALETLVCDERDRALLTTLVYGVTERRVTLDYYIAALSDRPTDKIGARLLMVSRSAPEFSHRSKKTAYDGGSSSVRRKAFCA